MARRFTFRLQPVLEQRERAERDQQVRVAALERQRVELESRLKELDRRASEERQQLRERLGASAPAGVGVRVPLDMVRQQTSAGLHHGMMARRIAIELAGVHAGLQRERQALARASAARKAVDLLKEKRLAEFVREAQRRELAELDEITVMRHARGDNLTEMDR